MRIRIAVVLTFLIAAVAAAADKTGPRDIPLRDWPVNFTAVHTSVANPGGRLQPETNAVPSLPSNFITLSPCRVADTRGNGFTGAYGTPSLVASAGRNFTIAGQCGIPSGAAAVSFNFTIADTTSSGDLRVYPTNGTPATVSTINWTAPTVVIANAAITPLGTGGAITVVNESTTAVDLIIDVNGYFLEGPQPSSANTPNTLVLRDGTGSFAANTITATKVLGAVYQDVAEWVPSSGTLPGGTVVALDPADGHNVVASTRAYDTAVAGVVSENPGIVLGTPAANKLQIATTGRVRVLVDADAAPIRVGDLLVTSNVPGMAMRSQPVNIDGQAFHRPGTIIGKALEPLASGKGRVLVLLSLQ